MDRGGARDASLGRARVDYVLSVDAAPGEHTIAVRVQDEYENSAADKAVVK